jgi:hypothetical protein
MCRKIVTDTYVGDDRRKYEEWHLDKNVPITIIGALLLYAALAVWWGGKMDTRMLHLEDTQNSAIELYKDFAASAEKASKKYATREEERVYDALLRKDIENLHNLLSPMSNNLIRLDLKMDSMMARMETNMKNHEAREQRMYEHRNTKEADN